MRQWDPHLEDVAEFVVDLGRGKGHDLGSLGGEIEGDRSGEKAVVEQWHEQPQPGDVEFAVERIVLEDDFFLRNKHAQQGAVETDTERDNRRFGGVGLLHRGGLAGGFFGTTPGGLRDGTQGGNLATHVKLDARGVRIGRRGKAVPGDLGGGPLAHEGGRAFEKDRGSFDAGGVRIGVGGFGLGGGNVELEVGGVPQGLQPGEFPQRVLEQGAGCLRGGARGGGAIGDLAQQGSRQSHQPHQSKGEYAVRSHEQERRQGQSKKYEFTKPGWIHPSRGGRCRFRRERTRPVEPHWQTS